MDELVNLLVQQYGSATSSRGVQWYSLDNEPALWSSTHPRIHPQKVGAQELLDRSIALASAVKDVDPAAKIMGPAAYGVSEYVSLQDAPDWNAVKGSSEWFLDWYLDGMRQGGATAGRRLLDALDVHYYPEARGDHRITDSDANTAADVAARLQAPRMLWDSTYRETSWVGQYMGQFLPLLPRLRRSIAEHYPGTALAITEYDFGGGATISGGIAQADVLGIFGREGVQVATRWGIRAEDLFAAKAFLLYRDYDGKGGTFGGTSVRALTSDTARTSVYASIDDASGAVLHLILLNKDQGETLNVHVNISGGAAYSSGVTSWFDASKTGSGTVAAVTPAGFTITVTPLSATHVVLRAAP
jgi:mannan endo-1,4-beta-mannosidase